MIRLIDATTIPKAGALANTQNKLWRIHSVFDLPSERFGFFALTDENGGERLDRTPVVEGEIRIGDRAYLQPHRIGPCNLYFRLTLPRAQIQAGRQPFGM